MSSKIAIVVQRYGLEISGGAEYHARLIAEKLARYFTVEVFTTTAYDYITWDHFYEKQLETLNGIVVNRFRVDKPRDPQAFGQIQNVVFNEEHSPADELRWLEEEGPLVPGLIQELERREGEFAYFIFFSYRYYHSYWGVKRLAGKAILVPTAEHDQVVYLNLFKEYFNLPAAIVYNSPEEKELLNRVSGNSVVYGDVVGVGSEIPARFDPEGIRRELGIVGKYALYIGRLDENKGMPELLRFYLRLLDEKKNVLDLLLVGKALIAVPEHPRIRPLGFRNDREKFDLLKGGEFLIIPSQFESLSMVTLEAWALGKPVLANGRTEVLRGQCRRSNAGLWYSNYDEFKEAFLILQEDGKLRGRLGANGKKFFQANYSWPVIEAKYMEIIAALDKRK
ncbi:MAG: glycosyltransferase family 4 protein [Candidatus Aminicenantes bacterium]|nr:glycosyltransferase family 4 protein [Candidatus Aminicenantes bacterium]